MDAEQPKEAVRLGKIVFQIGYIVNLNDLDMVQHAKDAIHNDLMYVMHTGDPEEFNANFQEIEDRTLKVSDIPEWLKENPDECEE